MAADNATGLGGVTRSYKHLLIVAGVIGAVGLAAGIVFGHYIAGVTFVGGMLLGWINTMMTLASAGKFSRQKNPAKGPVVASTLRRLAVLSAISLVVAFLLRPDGVAIIFGLLFFHMLMVGNTSRGLLVELRRTQP